MKILNMESHKWLIVHTLFIFFFKSLLISLINHQTDQLQVQDTPNVLIVGGGSHHDFERWFDQEDREIISQTGAEVRYTDEPAGILEELPELDVLYLSNNQPLTDTTLREGIVDFVRSGNGLLLVHAATWYNWSDWPEYNRELVGGGTHSHPPYGEFEVVVIDPQHEIMSSVPERFFISDELYRFEKDEDGSDIHILAMGIEAETGEEYPVAWTVEYGNGRIVCITLGHDGEAHQHEAFRTILQNSIHWLTE